MRLSPIQLTMVGLGMAITALPAQSEKAEKALILRSSLSDRQEQFEAKLASATASLNQTFVAKLRQFERQAAQAEDFANAIVYRDRRLALTESIRRHNPDRATNAVTPVLSEAAHRLCLPSAPCS